MTLASGTKLGGYEILSELGAGGMGEVYRARDTRLNRDVALKVLPELLAADRERLVRFEREAHLLASLNHQNIAQIYGVEDSGAAPALILELVEGPTLADRIAMGPVPLDEARAIASQIADALEYAHERGVIHRDLKPANVKVRPDGVVKVLDFGLAKALEGPDQAPPNQSAMNSPTLTARGTELGLVIGTAAYMAPEQARGRSVDRRADIWAFGVVLYEMLTGRRAFEGDDISITLASVLKDDLKWGALPQDLPPSVHRLLRRCLAKEPKRRLSAIGDARLELEESTEGTIADAPPVTTATRQTAWLAWTIAALATAAAAVTIGIWQPWRRPPDNLPVRISADIGVEGPLAVNMGAAATISPDGRVTVFVVQRGGRNVLYVRRGEQLNPTLLAGTDDAHSPFFSPDSQWIGFFTLDKLKKIAVGGGTPITLTDAPNGRGGAWGENGTIVFQPSTPGTVLYQVSDAGGSATVFGKRVEGEITQRWPQVLPDGKGVIYSANTATIAWDAGTVMAQPPGGGEPKVVLRGGYYPRYVNSGHLLFGRSGTLFAVPFDLDRLAVRGRETPVVEQLLAAVNTGGAQYSVSDTGTLLYVPGKSIDPELPVSWIDRTGNISLLRAEPTNWAHPAFSPDGRQLAMTIGFGVAADVWIYDWARDSLVQLTFGRGGDNSPAWTPDGRRIAFASSTEASPVTNLFWRRSDGSADAQRLTSSPNAQIPYSFHPSGKYLTYVERRAETNTDLMILPLEGDETSGWKAGAPMTFLATPAVENSPVFSPDGRWIAYGSNESGTMEIYVQPFGAGKGKWKISAARGGMYPVWSRAPNRSELFYVEPVSGEMGVMVVGYHAEGDSFRPERPRRWYPSLITASRPIRPYDVHPDGNRIAVARPPESTGPQQKPVFVFNFLDELRRTVK